MNSTDIEAIEQVMVTLHDQRQVKFRFTNGYGASVISDGYGVEGHRDTVVPEFGVVADV